MPIQPPTIAMIELVRAYGRGITFSMERNDNFVKTFYPYLRVFLSGMIQDTLYIV